MMINIDSYEGATRVERVQSATVHLLGMILEEIKELKKENTEEIPSAIIEEIKTEVKAKAKKTPKKKEVK